MRIPGGSLLLLALVVSCTTAVPEIPPPNRPPPQPAPAGEMRVNLPSRPSLDEVLISVQSTPPVGAAREALLREEALREQAGLPPNPILNVFASRIDLADVGGGPQKYRVFLRERLETAGKREARVLTATGRYHETLAESRAVMFRTARAAGGAQQRAVASQEMLALRGEALATSGELLAIEEKLVASGRRKASVLPEYRERVAAAKSAFLEEEARLKSALRNLEGILSISPGTLDGVRGNLLTSSSLPAAGDGPLIDENPAVLVAMAAQEIAEAELRAAKAKAYPDVTVGIDYEDNQEFGERLHMIGLNLEAELPVFDTNVAGIRAAHAEVRRTRIRFAEVRAAAAAGYAEAREVAGTLHRGVESRQTGVIPARRQEVEFARLAHDAGRTDRRPLLAADLALLTARIELTELQSRVAGWNLDALALIGREPSDWGPSQDAGQ